MLYKPLILSTRKKCERFQKFVYENRAMYYTVTRITL